MFKFTQSYCIVGTLSTPGLSFSTYKNLFTNSHILKYCGWRLPHVLARAEFTLPSAVRSAALRGRSIQKIHQQGGPTFPHRVVKDCMTLAIPVHAHTPMPDPLLPVGALMGCLCQDAIHPKKTIQELCTCCAWGGQLRLWCLLPPARAGTEQTDKMAFWICIRPRQPC